MTDTIDLSLERQEIADLFDVASEVTALVRGVHGKGPYLTVNDEWREVLTRIEAVCEDGSDQQTIDVLRVAAMAGDTTMIESIAVESGGVCAECEDGELIAGMGIGEEQCDMHAHGFDGANELHEHDHREGAI